MKLTSGLTFELDSNNLPELGQCWQLEGDALASKQQTKRKSWKTLFTTSKRQASGKVHIAPVSQSKTSGFSIEEPENCSREVTQTPRNCREKSCSTDTEFALPGSVDEIISCHLPVDHTRLRDVKHKLNEFSKRAQQGVWCTYFEERTQQRKQGLYCLDAKLQNMIILTGDKLEKEELICPMACVEGVWSRESGADGLSVPPSVEDLLRPHELEKLVMVTFQCARDSSMLRFSLLEESSQSVADFVQSISVLSKYTQSMKKTKRAQDRSRTLD